MYFSWVQPLNFCYWQQKLDTVMVVTSFLFLFFKLLSIITYVTRINFDFDDFYFIFFITNVFWPIHSSVYPLCIDSIFCFTFFIRAVHNRNFDEALHAPKIKTSQSPVQSGRVRKNLDFFSRLINPLWLIYSQNIFRIVRGCSQHLRLPRGPPTKYWPGSTVLNFGEQTIISVFSVIWP